MEPNLKSGASAGGRDNPDRGSSRSLFYMQPNPLVQRAGYQTFRQNRQNVYRNFDTWKSYIFPAVRAHRDIFKLLPSISPIIYNYRNVCLKCTR